MDYIPVFVANNFYKNRTQFIRRHVVYNSFVRFPKVERFLEEGRLNRLKRQVIVMMKYEKKTNSIYKTLWAEFDKANFAHSRSQSSVSLFFAVVIIYKSFVGLLLHSMV